jgi:hypothetical protein
MSTLGRMCQHSAQNAALDSEMHRTAVLISIDAICERKKWLLRFIVIFVLIMIRTAKSIT